MIKSEDKAWLHKTIADIYGKMDWVSTKSQGKIPATTIDGVHDNRRVNLSGRREDGLKWWTNGFFAGMMWLMYHQTGEHRYADIAGNTEQWLDQTFDDFYGLHHDVGFMWMPSAVAHYRLTGNLESRKRGLHAASLLAGRFNPVGRFIRAWDGVEPHDTTGWGIIDCMCNLPLLYWASEEIKDPRFSQIAEIHAGTVIDAFVRENGSCEHIVEFDPHKGGKVKIYGGQGYADGSAWTRGQSWGLYGFTLSYMHNKKPEFLETARRIADYWITQIPESGLIPIDFDQPAEPALEDSTATAVASCGLIELSRIVGGEEGQLYLNAAVKMLKTLTENRCNWTKEFDGILENCSGSYHGKESHHISLIYADCYFMEAMFKLKGDDFLLW
ncbi:MAG: glycoside hydrolase family 88 protein [Spirochaetales bacterium]|nr:glycoside hydrolase family 88 protein [Spirochaetales bacterium]